MGLELRQQLKLSQQLVMTPQLQQAIKLLQLSRFELAETIQQEMLENPFLEEAAGDTSGDINDERTVETATDMAYDEAVALNADWEDYLGDFSSTTRQASVAQTEFSEDGLAYDAHYTTKPSLESHLLWQLRLSPQLSDSQKEIGETIIANLGSSGYLQATLEEIAGLGSCTIDEVGHVLSIIQNYDPIGVACQTPQE